MRRIVVGIIVMTLVSSLFAQEPPRRRPPGRGQILFDLDAQEERLRALTAALKRDAFIVSKLVAAIGELESFQKNAAIQDALDRVNEAIKRAQERPQAPQEVQLALSQAHDELTTARRQGTLTNFEALERTLMKKTRVVERAIFLSFEDVRRERAALTEILTRVSRMTAEMDDATGEALGATFDYFKAGGE